MCSKRMVFLVLLVCFALASVSAWPSMNLGTKAAAPVEDAEVEVEAPKASTPKKTTEVSKKAETLQSKVSALQETLSSSSSNAKKLEAVEELLNNAETGLAQMTDAYEKAMKEVDGFHLAGLLTTGYTTGKPVAQAFDAGLELVGRYKKGVMTLGVTKALDFNDFGGAFKTGKDYRVSIGGGYQFF